MVMASAVTMGCSAAPTGNDDENVGTVEEGLGYPTHCDPALTLPAHKGYAACTSSSPAGCWTDNFVRFEGLMNGDNCRAGGKYAEDGTVLRTIVHYVTSAGSRDTNLYFYALCEYSAVAAAEPHIAQFANVAPVWSKGVYCYKDGYAATSKTLGGHGGVVAVVSYYDPTCQGCAPGPAQYIGPYTYE
jgi:hypothetical protein